MANVISQLLIGVGFDYDKKGVHEIGTGIDTVKSKALQLGAVVAGAFGIGKMTKDFADARAELGRFGEAFNVDPSQILAVGTAIESQGGSLEKFMGDLENIEKIRARLLVGDAAFFAPAGKAGIDPNAVIDAENATEAFLGLADSFAKMTQQQRLNAGEVFGFDKETILFLSQGGGQVDTLVTKFGDIRDVTASSVAVSKELNAEWVEIEARVNSVGDIIGERFTKKLADSLNLINDIADSGDGKLTEGVENAAVVAVESGSIVATIASFIAPFVLSGDEKPEVFIDPTVTPPPSGASFSPYPGAGGGDPRLQSISPVASPTTTTPQVSNVNVTLNLDGATLDKRTVRVVDGMAQTAIDDIQSSTEG